jgi:hypothetical protein
MKIRFGLVMLKNLKNTYTQVPEITQIWMVGLMLTELILNGLRYLKQAKPVSIYST